MASTKKREGVRKANTRKREGVRKDGHQEAGGVRKDEYQETEPRFGNRFSGVETTAPFHSTRPRTHGDPHMLLSRHDRFIFLYLYIYQHIGHGVWAIRLKHGMAGYMGPHERGEKASR